MTEVLPHCGTIALVWVADQPAAGLGAYLAVVASAGLVVSELLVLDATSDAGTSLALRRSLASNRLSVIRLPTGHGLGEVCDTALQATWASVLLFCDAATPLEAEALRGGFDQLVDGTVDGWLGASVVAALEDGPLPTDFRGALLRRSVVSAVAAQCDGNRSNPRMVLSGVPRLTTEPCLSAGAIIPSMAVVAERGAPGVAELGQAAAVRTDAGGRFKSAFTLLSRQFRASCPTVLLIGHGLGGGTTRYQRILGNLIRDDVNVLHAWGDDERRLLLSARAPDAPEVAVDLIDGVDVVVRLLRALGVQHVDVLHSIGLDKHIDELLGQLDVPHDLSLMDYHHFATTDHLLDEQSVFVGDGALADSQHPMRRRGPRRQLITQAHRLIACSRDLAARLTRLAPELAFLPVHIPEPHARRLNVVRPYPIREGEPFRVVFMGRFDRLKGSTTVVEVARLCHDRGLPVEFHVLGELVDTVPTRDQKVLPLFLYDRFREEQVDCLLGEIRPHMAWFPFAAPETYSFTLSDAIAHQLPIVTVGLGAIAERLEGRPYTWILKAEDANPEAWTDLIEQLQREKLATPARWRLTVHLPPLVEDFYERRYLTDVIERIQADRRDDSIVGTADPGTDEIGIDRGIAILTPAAVPPAGLAPSAAHTLARRSQTPSNTDCELMASQQEPENRNVPFVDSEQEPLDSLSVSSKTYSLIERTRARWDQIVSAGSSGQNHLGRPIRFRFFINSGDLRLHDVYLLNSHNTLRGDNAIVYLRSRHAAIEEQVLFFGPYISLPPAVYVFTFGGQIEGQLTLEFARDRGAAILKRFVVDSFRKPISLTIDRPVINFEIRGRRTDSLKRLRIERITVDRIRFDGKPS